MKQYTAAQVREMIRAAMRKERLSQREYAKARGMSESYLSDILAGKREPGNLVLAPLGLGSQTVYVRTA